MKNKSRLRRNVTVFFKSQRRYLFKTTVVLLIFAILNVVNLLSMYFVTKNSNVYNHPHYNNNISCYSATNDDALIQLSNELISISNNIFLVETSCKGYLDARQACIVEAAAKAHPYRLVNILFVSPVTSKVLDNGILLKLQEFDNVNIERIRLDKVLKQFKLEKLLNHSIAKVSHASDILRWYLLWKYGGVYMDLDMLTLKSFDSLSEDFAGFEGGGWVGSSIVGLSKSKTGRKIAKAIIRKLRKHFNPNDWGANGPKMLTNTLEHLCNFTNHSTLQSKNCLGFITYDQQFFYPVGADWWLRLWTSEALDLNSSYTVHLWNKNSFRRKIHSKTLVYKLAKQFCPTIFGSFGGQL